VKSAGDFLVGTIPVVNLSLDKQLLLDGWNSKFVFAVAAKYTYHDTDGGINANNKFMSDTLSLDSGPNNQKYMYAIISNGLDKNGAYSKNGLLVRSLKQTDPKRCLTNTYDGFDPEKLVETGTNENCDDQTLLISRSQKIMELQLVSEIPCDLEKNLEKVLKHCEHSMNGIKLTEFNTKDFPSYKLLYPGQKISSNYKDFIWEETIGGESYKSIPRKIACTVECKPGSRLKAYKDILLLQQ
jgi:hypothetical protein